MTVEKLMSRQVATTRADAAIQDAARLMRTNHVGDLVVVEEEEGLKLPVGILTDRDLVLEILSQDLSPDLVAVKDVMTADPVLATADDDLWDTVERMRATGVRRVPVVDSQGSLIGIITLDDVIDHVAGLLSGLREIVRREIGLESKRRPACRE